MSPDGRPFGWRRFVARALLAFVTFAAAGCAQRAADVTVVRFWAMGREGEVVSALMPDFEREHPGIRVVVQQLPWTAAHQKLLTAFAGDATPDVCQLGNTWIPEFVALRALEALDARIARAGLDPGDFFAGIWDTNVIGGRVFGVPWYVDTRLLFYRTDLFAQAGVARAPVSWAEWTHALAAVKARAGAGRYAMLLPTSEFEPLLAFALSQDEPLLRDDARHGNFSSAGFRRALAFYTELFRDGYAPIATVAEIANVWSEFGRGTFASFVSGPWNIGELDRRLPAALQATWTTAPLPGPDGPGTSIAGGSSLVLFRASHAKDAAWQLVEWLSRPDIELRFHRMTGDLPPRRSAWRDAALAADARARAFREQLERVKPAPKIPEWERIADELRVVAERTARGDMSIEDATRELDARAERILEKRRWLLAHGARD